MFELCESLQKKLKLKAIAESETLKQMEFLLLKTQQANDFSVESRDQISQLENQLAQTKREL